MRDLEIAFEQVFSEADDGPVRAGWYVAFDDEEVGPLTLAELGRYVEAARVDPTTQIWRAGLRGWTSAGEVPEVDALFVAPPIPPRRRELSALVDAELAREETSVALPEPEPEPVVAVPLPVVVVAAPPPHQPALALAAIVVASLLAITAVAVAVVIRELGSTRGTLEHTLGRASLPSSTQPSPAPSVAPPAAPSTVPASNVPSSPSSTASSSSSAALSSSSAAPSSSAPAASPSSAAPSSASAVPASGTSASSSRAVPAPGASTSSAARKSAASGAKAPGCDAVGLGCGEAHPDREELSRGDIVVGVRKNLAGVRACAAKLGSGGLIHVAWKILPNGNVTNARILDGKGGTALGNCVRDAVLAWKFPTSTKESIVDNFPLPLQR